MHWSSIAVGALGLALLDAVLTHTESAGRLGSFLGHVGGAAQRFLSPEVAAFGTGQAGVKTTAPAKKTTSTPPAKKTTPSGVGNDTVPPIATTTPTSALQRTPHTGLPFVQQSPTNVGRGI